ncbi:peptide chain release factor 3 [Lacicoccus alkaliphilus]|uniref:Peptide chain release factor 3 n=1 Tax=Lacicoccus alkaliphilus DSM 16010 TaxID=1123231 RepID=A0A1M7G365_9BACL|nr:peptide chain release factor 3 [Salinicoccus alkaliphilus]SHM10814.1 peptide chain release factor 3 [Salinicoccus alkaliphilus DSM 16010]
MTLETEIKRRKTFAIISHPDAGKTTLTEKLLLFGGAIRSAGTVKGKKSGKFATSDWMKVEQERGISVTSSVMQFDFDGYKINILDTPGHEDFSEDTYRTLMAVDSAVMVIDAAKGIEPQTLKLFKVCRMRGIPIFTFINKMDRMGKEPFELLEEIEETLEIETYPMTWPVGMGQSFFGIINRKNKQINPFREEGMMQLNDDYELETPHPISEDEAFQTAMEEFMLVEEAGDAFDEEKIAGGELTPVFFGSALTTFGIEEFLDTYVDFAPMPTPRKTEAGGSVDPTEDGFTGFIFKIQANMDPRHRDRLAFMRIVSGKFTRGMDAVLARTGKKQKVTRATMFMADDTETVEEAYAGDIIGLYDTGNYQIGDTLYGGGGGKVEFESLPQFTPELFMKVSAKNVMKQKHFYKGIEQLVQEGAIQYYKTIHTNQPILGAVGQLQFEVFEHRMKNEYNTDVVMEPIGKKIARWIENEADITESMNSPRSNLVLDRYDNQVFLFENEFATRWFSEKFPEIKLYSLL